MNKNQGHAELIEEMTAAVSEAINTKGTQLPSFKVGGTLPPATVAGVEAAGEPDKPALVVREFAVPWALLWPVAQKLAPSATHAVLGFLSARFGPQIAAFLGKYEDKIQAIVDPKDWASIKSVLDLLIPANLAPHLDPAVRPMFGAVFATEVPSLPPGARTPKGPGAR